MKIDTAYTAHLGGREEQQDAVAILERADGSECLVVLADGMGGHAGGSLASRTVVETAKRVWKDDGAPNEPRDLLATIIQSAHDAINRAGEDQNLSPRSTCVLLLLRDGMAHWAHVGDSRLYRFRDGGQLGRTRDHSVVQMLFDMGKISEEEMGTHPDQNRLTQSLGGDTDPEPDFGSDEARDGDGFVLCSDGLWEMVRPEEMAGALAEKGLDSQPERLAATAFDRAGRQSDNISVAMVRLGGAAAAAALAASEAPTRLAASEAPTRLATAGTAAAGPRRKSGGAKLGLAFLLVGVLAVGAAAAVVRPWEEGSPALPVRPETTAAPKDEVTIPEPKPGGRNKFRRSPDSQPKEDASPPSDPKKDASRQPAPEPAPDSNAPRQAPPRTTPPKSAPLPTDPTDDPRTAPDTDMRPPSEPAPQATPRTAPRTAPDEPPETRPETAPQTPPQARPQPQTQTQPETTPKPETRPKANPTRKPGATESAPVERGETGQREDPTPELLRPGGPDDKSRFRRAPDPQRDQE